jgi:acetaldehyde dehydrogenase (acetylating)
VRAFQALVPRGNQLLQRLNGGIAVPMLAWDAQEAMLLSADAAFEKIIDIRHIDADGAPIMAALLDRQHRDHTPADRQPIKIFDCCHGSMTKPWPNFVSRTIASAFPIVIARSMTRSASPGSARQCHQPASLARIGISVNQMNTSNQNM